MKTFSKTDVGRKREMNQDYVYARTKPVGKLPNLFAVADGMGGHNAEIVHPSVPLRYWNVK